MLDEIRQDSSADGASRNSRKLFSDPLSYKSPSTFSFSGHPELNDENRFPELKLEDSIWKPDSKKIGEISEKMPPDFNGRFYEIDVDHNMKRKPKPPPRNLGDGKSDSLKKGVKSEEYSTTVTFSSRLMEQNEENGQPKKTKYVLLFEARQNQEDEGKFVVKKDEKRKETEKRKEIQPTKVDGLQFVKPIEEIQSFKALEIDHIESLDVMDTFEKLSLDERTVESNGIPSFPSKSSQNTNDFKETWRTKQDEETTEPVEAPKPRPTMNFQKPALSNISHVSGFSNVSNGSAKSGVSLSSTNEELMQVLRFKRQNLRKTNVILK